MIFGVLDIHVVKKIAPVPEIGVDGNNSQLGVFRMIDAVRCVMHPSFVSCLRSDPVVLLP